MLGEDRRRGPSARIKFNAMGKAAQRPKKAEKVIEEGSTKGLTTTSPDPGSELRSGSNSPLAGDVIVKSVCYLRCSY